MCVCGAAGAAATAVAVREAELPHGAGEVCRDKGTSAAGTAAEWSLAEQWTCV